MELTKTQRNFAIGSILTLIAGISIYVYRQYSLLVDAGKKLIGAKVHNLSLDKIKLTTFIEIDNKGDLSVDVVGQNYNVYVNGTFVSNITVNDNIRISSNGKSVLPLTIEFNPKVVFLAGLQNLTNIMADKSKVVISIAGTLSLKTGILTINNFVFDMNMTLDEILNKSNETV